MKAKTKRFMTIALVFLTLLAVTPTIAGVWAQPSDQITYGYDEETGQITLLTDQIGIRITGITAIGAGNVPHVLFWNPADTEMVYHLKFIQLIEFVDANNDDVLQYNENVPESPIFALAAAPWNFSGFVNDSEGVHFNLTLDTEHVDMSFIDIPAGYGGLPDYSGLTLNLSCHIYYTVTVGGPYEIKIDVVISGWDWNSTDPNVMLALGVDLTWDIDSEVEQQIVVPGGDIVDENTVIHQNEEIAVPDTPETQEEVDITSDDQTLAYFKYNDTAEYDVDTLNVAASYRTSDYGIMLFLCYPKWTGTLIHDPSVGVTENTVSLLAPFYFSPVFLVAVSIAIISVFGVTMILRKNGKI